MSLRFFNVYGPRQTNNSYGFVIGIFTRQILANTPPTVFGDGQQTRDFVYIADNIVASLAALERDQAHGQIINIGSGKETRIVDLAHLIIAIAQKSNLLQPELVSGRQHEIERRCASAQRMRQLLNVDCATSLEAGIEMMLREYLPVPEMPHLKKEVVLQPV